MASPTKIDMIEMDRLITEGKSTAEIARHFGVTMGAVSQAKRKLGVAMAQKTAVQYAPELVEKKNDAMARLINLADRCDRELRWIEKAVPPSTDEEYRQWQEAKIKHTAEIRKLISTMADIRVKIYHAESVERALKIMFEEIGHESPECQKRIRDRLERSSIHLAMDD